MSVCAVVERMALQRAQELCSKPELMASTLMMIVADCPNPGKADWINRLHSELLGIASPQNARSHDTSSVLAVPSTESYQHNSTMAKPSKAPFIRLCISWCTPVMIMLFDCCIRDKPQGTCHAFTNQLDMQPSWWRVSQLAMQR